jgi:hypothetical protein
MYSLALIIFVASEKKASTWTIETKLPRNSHWKVLYKVYGFFMPIENSKWPPPQDID